MNEYGEYLRKLDDIALTAELANEETRQLELYEIGEQSNAIHLVNDTAKDIYSQIPASFAGLVAMKDVLNQNRKNQSSLDPLIARGAFNDFKKVVGTAIQSWAKNDGGDTMSILDYVAEQEQEQSGMKFSLVATPNIEITMSTVDLLVKGLKNKQQFPHLLDVGSPEYIDKHFEASQISGTGWAPRDYDFRLPYLLSLVPNRVYPSTMNQDDALLMQAVAAQKLPGRIVYAPSILDNVSRWYGYYAAGKPLNLDSTGVAHFGIHPASRSNGIRYIPYTATVDDRYTTYDLVRIDEPLDIVTGVR